MTKARKPYDDARIEKLRGAADFVRAFATVMREQDSNCSRMIAAGFGDVRPSDIESAFRVDADAMPPLWREHKTLSDELWRLRLAAQIRWDRWKEGEIWDNARRQISGY